MVIMNYGLSKRGMYKASLKYKLIICANLSFSSFSYPEEQILSSSCSMHTIGSITQAIQYSVIFAHYITLCVVFVFVCMCIRRRKSMHLLLGIYRLADMISFLVEFKGGIIRKLDSNIVYRLKTDFPHYIYLWYMLVFICIYHEY